MQTALFKARCHRTRIRNFRCQRTRSKRKSLNARRNVCTWAPLPSFPCAVLDTKDLSGQSHDALKWVPVTGFSTDFPGCSWPVVATQNSANSLMVAACVDLHLQTMKTCQQKSAGLSEVKVLSLQLFGNHFHVLILDREQNSNTELHNTSSKCAKHHGKIRQRIIHLHALSPWPFHPRIFHLSQRGRAGPVNHKARHNSSLLSWHNPSTNYCVLYL